MFATTKDTLDKVDVLPIFPLTGAVLLPSTQLPLNIFEPRYVAMVLDALRGDRLIGMIQPSVKGESDPLHAVGCAGRVTAFEETTDNRLEIILNGVCRFRIERELSLHNGYRRVVPDWSAFWGDLAQEQADDLIELDTLINCVQQFIDAGQAKGSNEALASIPPAQLTNLLSVGLPFSPEEKQTLLEAPSVVERAETLTHMTLLATQSGNSSTPH